MNKNVLSSKAKYMLGGTVGEDNLFGGRFHKDHGRSNCKGKIMRFCINYYN